MRDAAQLYHMKHSLSSYIKPCHNYTLWQHVIYRSAHVKRSFSVSEEYHCAFLNVRKLSNIESAFVIISKHALLGVFDFNNIVKCDLLWKVIMLHLANILSKPSESRCHPSPIRGQGLFYLVICLFHVSSCDKKNLKWIFIPYDVLWNSYVLYHLARGSRV